MSQQALLRWGHMRVACTQDGCSQAAAGPGRAAGCMPGVSKDSDHACLPGTPEGWKFEAPLSGQECSGAASELSKTSPGCLSRHSCSMHRPHHEPQGEATALCCRTQAKPSVCPCQPAKGLK